MDMRSRNPSAQPGQRFFGDGHHDLGLQIFTLGEMVMQDLPRVLNAIAAIGYREVEFIGYVGRGAAALRKEVDAAGLRCRSMKFPPRAWHPEMPALDADLDRILQDAPTLGLSTIVEMMFLIPDRLWKNTGSDAEFVTMIESASQRFTLDDWQRNADFLNDKGAAVKRAGLQLAFHNSNLEFAPLELPDGTRTSGYDLLLELTDPDLVKFELDVGYLVSAGRDPVEMLQRHPERFRLLHVKDLKKPAQPNTSTYRAHWTEVGSGDVDWPAVMRAAQAGGVEHYYVEQEPPYAVPPLEAVRISYEFLRQLRV